MELLDKLPLGLQDFSSVIESNLIYVDKTKIILTQLVSLSGLELLKLAILHI